MKKLIASLFLICLSQTSNAGVLNLNCAVTYSEFAGVDHASKFKKVALSGGKNEPNGASLVTQTDDYEFWVMAHGKQKLNGVKFYNSFQVAIKTKNSGQFTHALSDFNVSPTGQPKAARISLIKYARDSFLEVGELMFECKST